MALGGTTPQNPSSYARILDHRQVILETCCLSSRTAYSSFRYFHFTTGSWSTASTHLFNQIILYQNVGINNGECKVNSRTVNKKTTVAVTLTLFLSSKI